jgi:hypothetical protein
VTRIDWTGTSRRKSSLLPSPQCKMGNHLGIDGLPCEFYKVMWDTTGDDFCNLAYEVFSLGSLSGVT